MHEVVQATQLLGVDRLETRNSSTVHESLVRKQVDILHRTGMVMLSRRHRRIAEGPEVFVQGDAMSSPVGGGLGPGVHVELGEDVLDVRPHLVPRELELGLDRAAVSPFHEQLENASLDLRQVRSRLKPCSHARSVDVAMRSTPRRWVTSPATPAPVVHLPGLRHAVRPSRRADARQDRAELAAGGHMSVGVTVSSGGRGYPLEGSPRPTQDGVPFRRRDPSNPPGGGQTGRRWKRGRKDGVRPDARNVGQVGVELGAWLRVQRRSVRSCSRRTRWSA